MSRFVRLALVVLVTACGNPPSSEVEANDVRSDGICPAGETCLATKAYEVVFTNPVCASYEYSSPVPNAAGTGELLAKPKNVYCTHEDSLASGSRPDSPQSRLRGWIDELVPGDEVFLAFLSFSDPVIADALCRAAQDGVVVHFIVDSENTKVTELRECGANIETRGHQGSVGFQHNKLVMVNPKEPGPSDEDPKYVRMAFGSGNASTGTHLHHENWHFGTFARDSYFVENHLCLVKALTDPSRQSTNGKGKFRRALKACREEISFPPESDMKTFFIPALDDRRDARKTMERQMRQATSVDIAAHRFSWRQMLDAMGRKLKDDPNFVGRLVVDDDLYWLQPLVGASELVGFNSPDEAEEIGELIVAGGGESGAFDDESRFQMKFMETNHRGHLLHHNKFMIFRDETGAATAVLYGAANFTGTGYNSNLENVYFSTIPEIVSAFDKQFGRFWGDSAVTPEDPEPPRATKAPDMPAVDLSPTLPFDPS